MYMIYVHYHRTVLFRQLGSSRVLGVGIIGSPRDNMAEVYLFVPFIYTIEKPSRYNQLSDMSPHKWNEFFLVI